MSLAITRHQSYLLIYDQTPHKHAQKQAKTNFSCFSPSQKGSAATKQYTRLHGPIGRSSRPVRVYRCRVIPSWQSRPCIKARRSCRSSVVELLLLRPSRRRRAVLSSGRRCTEKKYTTWHITGGNWRRVGYEPSR